MPSPSPAARPIVLADFGMETIEIPGFVTVADHGVLELQLVLQPA